jgi:hypothetical protein
MKTAISLSIAATTVLAFEQRMGWKVRTLFSVPGLVRVICRELPNYANYNRLPVRLAFPRNVILESSVGGMASSAPYAKVDKPRRRTSARSHLRQCRHYSRTAARLRPWARELESKIHGILYFETLC